MAMLVLALNPSIDAEWRVKRVQWGEKNVVLSERRWAGGKGVNVARWLRHLRGESRLLLPLGGDTGREMARQLREEKLNATVIRLQQATRVNVIITTADRRQMRFNPTGPLISSAEWKTVVRKTAQALSSVDWMILSGSLPREAPDDLYTRLIRIAHKAGVRTLLDCDGAPFKSAIGAKPFLVKPNEHELAQWYGAALKSERKILQAAQALSSVTGGWVLASRGRRGAVLVNAGQGAALKAWAPRVEVLNTVGAGDAMLAAAARQLELASPPQEWLRWGVATATAATECEAGRLPALGRIHRLASAVRVMKS